MGEGPNLTNKTFSDRTHNPYASGRGETEPADTAPQGRRDLDFPEVALRPKGEPSAPRPEGGESFGGGGRRGVADDDMDLLVLRAVQLGGQVAIVPMPGGSR